MTIPCHPAIWARLGRDVACFTLCTTGCLLIAGGRLMQRGGITLVSLGARFAPWP